MPNMDFVAVAGGSGHGLGLKADTTMVAWGLNSWGQCNVPAPNSGFVAIAASWEHSLALTDASSIVAWGSGECGQSGDPHYGQSCVSAPNTRFIAVAAGGEHSLGLRMPGDMNCDGAMNFDDINPFVLAISSHAEYQAAYPDCNWWYADCNGDGYVDFDDINPFIAILSNSRKNGGDQ